MPLKQIKYDFSVNSDLKNIVDRVDSRPYKIFYRSLVPKFIRNKLKLKADLSQQAKVAEHWDKVIESYFDNELGSFLSKLKAKKSFPNQNIIWQYWGQGWNSSDLPKIVELCTKSIDKYKDDYTIIRLDDSTLIDYIEFPQFVEEKRQNSNFKFVFFSDLLRLSLLYLYGGVWLDATILLTNKISNKNYKRDFFVFERSEEAINKKTFFDFNKNYFSWDKNHKIRMLNSIIFAEKKNYFLGIQLDLLLYFWNSQTAIPHYFFYQIMFTQLIKHPKINYTRNPVDDTLPHLLQMKLNNKFNAEEFKEILSKSNLHKMTYVKECKPNSFYEKILNINK